MQGLNLGIVGELRLKLKAVAFHNIDSCGSVEA
jgi:hypothetical protein